MLIRVTPFILTYSPQQGSYSGPEEHRFGLLPNTDNSRAGNNPEPEVICILKVVYTSPSFFSHSPHTHRHKSTLRSPLAGEHTQEPPPRPAFAVGAGGCGSCTGLTATLLLGDAAASTSALPPWRGKYIKQNQPVFFCQVSEPKQFTERNLISLFGSF